MCDLLISGGQEDYMKSVVGPNITMGPKSAELTSQNVTVTRVKATLGREAIIKCRAENLVGQKTVCELYLKLRYCEKATKIGKEISLFFLFFELPNFNY